MALKELPIQSSCFTRLAYDEDTGELIMQFTKGGVYTIPNIEAIEVERWTQSESVGGYFNDHIRGRY